MCGVDLSMSPTRPPNGRHARSAASVRGEAPPSVWTVDLSNSCHHVAKEANNSGVECRLQIEHHDDLHCSLHPHTPVQLRCSARLRQV